MRKIVRKIRRLALTGSPAAIILIAPALAASMPSMSMDHMDRDMGDMPGMSMTGRMIEDKKPESGRHKSEGKKLVEKQENNPADAPKIVHHAADAPDPSKTVVFLGEAPVMDQSRWFHGILDEFEGRYHSGGGSTFRWDGESWYGSDYNKLWMKTEGRLTRGKLSDGDHELLYSRAISTYFDVQTGLRLDLDDAPARPWWAFGVQGLALYQFEVQATTYVSGRGFAARLEGSYDILITNRLILQPQIELNFYTQADPRRQVGAGLSDLDAGLRLRYEIWRKFAPYLAATYDSPLTQAKKFARREGDPTGQWRFTFGIRSWF